MKFVGSTDAAANINMSCVSRHMRHISLQLKQSLKGTGFTEFGWRQQCHIDTRSKMVAYDCTHLS